MKECEKCNDVKYKNLRDRVIASSNSIEQLLGKALGYYPWYKDDQKNFPNSTDADGVCVGEHTAETIAAEAAGVIYKLKSGTGTLNKDAPNERLLTTDYFVEATSFELSTLYFKNKDLNMWVPSGDGIGITVGKISDRPICISVTWARVNGITVAFWEATSPLVDYSMIEEWFAKNCPNYGRKTQCDANSAHQMISASRRT